MGDSGGGGDDVIVIVETIMEMAMIPRMTIVVVMLNALHCITFRYIALHYFCTGSYHDFSNDHIFDCTFVTISTLIVIFPARVTLDKT